MYCKYLNLRNNEELAQITMRKRNSTLNQSTLNCPGLNPHTAKLCSKTSFGSGMGFPNHTFRPNCNVIQLHQKESRHSTPPFI